MACSLVFTGAQPVRNSNAAPPSQLPQSPTSDPTASQWKMTTEEVSSEILMRGVGENISTADIYAFAEAYGDVLEVDLFFCGSSGAIAHALLSPHHATTKHPG